MSDKGSGGGGGLGVGERAEHCRFERRQIVRNGLEENFVRHLLIPVRKNVAQTDDFAPWNIRHLLRAGGVHAVRGLA